MAKKHSKAKKDSKNENSLRRKRVKKLFFINDVISLVGSLSAHQTTDNRICPRRLSPPPLDNSLKP